MNKIKQTVTINRSAHVVFEFTLDPVNTPKWIDSIVQEEVSEQPTKEGTIYRNQTSDGTWNEYEVTAFEQDRMFTFSKKDGEYHVKYTFTPMGAGQCELEYCEWTDSGSMEGLFSEDALANVLSKLKVVIESGEVMS